MLEKLSCERCSEAVVNVLVLTAEMTAARAGGSLALWRPVCDACWPDESEGMPVWRYCRVGDELETRRNTVEHAGRKNWARDFTDLNSLGSLLLGGLSAPGKP